MKIKEILKKNKLILSLYAKYRYAYFCVLTMLSPTLNTKAHFKQAFGRNINLKEPKSFCEKILKMKLDSYGTDPLIRQCADKYAVREYIQKKGCSEILVPLIAAYDKPEQIDWDALPEKFVIKWNFGCGFNIICDDKNKLKKAEVIAQLKKWGKVKSYLSHSEMQYCISEWDK